MNIFVDQRPSGRTPVCSLSFWRVATNPATKRREWSADILVCKYLAVRCYHSHDRSGSKLFWCYLFHYFTASSKSIDPFNNCSETSHCEPPSKYIRLNALPKTMVNPLKFFCFDRG